MGTAWFGYPFLQEGCHKDRIKRDSGRRRIVGLKSNPFNGGAESQWILSKERDTGYLPRCRYDDIAMKTLSNRQSLPEKPILKASA
jgi:hypothetical protein